VDFRVATPINCINTMCIYIYMIKKRVTPKQIMPQQIINFGANPIREGSWCVGGFVGGCGMRTIPFWSRANSTRSVGLDGRDAHENSAALEVRVA